MSGAVEHDYPQRSQTGGINHGGRREYVCLTADAEAVRNTLWDSALSDYTGPLATTPRCRHIDEVTNYPTTGFTKLIATFRTTRRAGIARVAGRLSAVAEPMARDLDDRPMDGLDIDAFQDDNADIRLYRMVRGQAVQYGRRGRLVIETAFEDTYPISAVMQSWMGHVNSNPFGELGLPAGTMLLMDNPFSELWFEDGLFYADFEFLVEPEGHNERLLAQRYTPAAVNVPSLDIDGAWSRDVTRQVLIELPKAWNAALEIWEDTTAEHRRAYPTTDFSALDDWLAAGRAAAGGIPWHWTGI